MMRTLWGDDERYVKTYWTPTPVEIHILGNKCPHCEALAALSHNHTDVSGPR